MAENHVPASRCVLAVLIVPELVAPLLLHPPLRFRDGILHYICLLCI